MEGLKALAVVGLLALGLLTSPGRRQPLPTSVVVQKRLEESSRRLMRERLARMAAATRKAQEAHLRWNLPPGLPSRPHADSFREWQKDHPEWMGEASQARGQLPFGNAIPEMETIPLRKDFESFRRR